MGVEAIIHGNLAIIKGHIFGGLLQNGEKQVPLRSRRSWIIVYTVLYYRWSIFSWKPLERFQLYSVTLLDSTII